MDKNQNRKEAVPLPPSPQGLRRSARLRDVPPPSPPAGEGGSDRASEKKRPRLLKEEEGKGHREEVKVADADDVMVSVQPSPRKVNPSLASGDGEECSEDGSRRHTGLRSLSRRPPLPLGNETAQSKDGGTISKLDKASSVSSTGVRTRSAVAAAGRSEVKPPEAEKEEAHPCLFIENAFNHNLESLRISFFHIDQDASWVDSIFSGIPEPDCRRIGRLRDFEAVNVNELQTRPSIVNLKNLRKLDMEFRRVNYWIGIGFTDVSAHFVFLKMDNLREIKLANWARQFSPRYLELLRDKLDLREPN